MAAECPFCKIVSGELPTAKVYEDQDFVAFLDIRPANPGHTLIVPKKHYAFLPELPEELNSNFLQLVKIIAQAQIEALNAEGVNVLQNNGSIAGQVVPHIHFHVIPRFKDDNLSFSWEPKPMKEEQLTEIQKRLTESAKGISSGKPSEPKPEAIEAPKEEKEEQPKGKLPKVSPRVP